MIDRVFIDTNVLVYVYNSDEANKQEIINRFIDNELIDCTIYISTQVMNEFYNTLSKKKFPHSIIKRYFNEIIYSFNILIPNIQISIKAIDLKEKYHYSWWDSLIIAAALENECSILYTEDLQHNQLIENRMLIKNPFFL